MKILTEAEKRRYAALEERRVETTTELRAGAWWCARLAELGLLPMDVARAAAAVLVTLARCVADGRLDLRHAADSSRVLMDWACKAPGGDVAVWTGGPIVVRPRGR